MKNAMHPTAIQRRTGEKFTEIVTQVLVRKGGRWQVVAAHATLANGQKPTATGDTPGRRLRNLLRLRRAVRDPVN
jgi:hypothetical protein